MEAIFNSLFLVTLGEIGDKTQLLSLTLVARYHRPSTILVGIFLATLANHALATWLGLKLTQIIDPNTLQWILALSFVIFAFWILIPDKEGDVKDHSAWGVLLTSFVAFFLAEMGDKTQLITVALGAKHADPLAVTVGSTLGMIMANAPALFLGKKLMKYLPVKKIRAIASIIFMAMGLLMLAKCLEII